MMKGVFFLVLGAFSAIGAEDVAEPSAYSIAAMEAARTANCLQDYAGKLTTSDRVSRVCDNGKPAMDSYVTRLCEGNECDNIRIRPFAKVTFECSEVVASVNCI
jgi:hypothetical protein